jgi:hypothetical protein
MENTAMLAVFSHAFAAFLLAMPRIICFNFYIIIRGALTKDHKMNRTILMKLFIPLLFNAKSGPWSGRPKGGASIFQLAGVHRLPVHCKTLNLNMGMWWLSWLKQLGDTRRRTQLS